MTIQRQDATPQALRRRGLMAGAAALAAGLVAKAASEPVRATIGDTIHVGDEILPPNSKRNFIGYTGATEGDGMWLITNNGAAHAIKGSSIGGRATSAGVFGESDNGTGVVGSYAPTGTNIPPQNHVGVYGYSINGSAGGYFECTPSPTTGNGGVGAIARGNGVGGTGLLASSDKGAGVVGQSPGSGTGVSGNSGSGTGVNGLSGSGIGVQGSSTSSIAVYGTSTGSVGVFGASTGSYGVLGVSTKPGFAGLTGITTTPSVPAFAGGSAVAGALAAQFTGGVFIDCTTAAGGQFVVNPMSAKFGTVQHADGSLRLMASMEAPESWAVDIGAGHLTAGHATVTFDADYAAVIHGADYRVSLTPEGDSKGVYVTNKTAAGFEVHEQQGGASNVGFTWVVYAHPRNQKSERLKKFERPVALKLEGAKPPTKP